ncbi:hypothetical protein M1466_02505 [Candidatus Dependentiae bacterium]|nr:hypothetical protein [Candidatus Dependentiae bacterium]
MKKILIIMLSIASVLSVAPVLSISTVDQVMNDMKNSYTSTGAFSQLYAPGTSGFKNLQQLTQDERNYLLQFPRSMISDPPAAGNASGNIGFFVNRAIAIRDILTKASFPPFSTKNLLVLQAANDILQGLNDGSFPYWYKPGTKGFKNLQRFKKSDRESLLEGLRKMLTPTNTNNTIAIAAILLKASSPKISDSALAQQVTEILKISSDDAVTGLLFMNNPLFQQTLNDIGKGLNDGSFPYWYKPGKLGFSNLQQFTQNDRDFLLKGLRKMLTPTNTNNAIAIAAILLKASSPQISDSALAQKLTETLKISSSDAATGLLFMNNPLFQQTLNDIGKGLNDGSFPYWYKPGKLGFINLQQFTQNAKDSLLEGLRMLAPTNKNTAAIAAILLKASSPQLSDAALAQKLTETLKISSSDAEKAVQQIEEK